MSAFSAGQTYAKHLVGVLSRQIGVDLNVDQFDSAAQLIMMLLEKEAAGETSLSLEQQVLDADVRKVLSRAPLLIQKDADQIEHLYTERTWTALQGVQQWFERACKDAISNAADAQSEQMRFKPSQVNGTTLTLGADDQIPAVLKAARNQFTVITGGPGTGKTTIIAACLAEIFLRNPELSPEHVVLTAPTGKAAHRLKQGLNDFNAAYLGSDLPDLQKRMCAVPDALTLHRLIGASKSKALPLTGTFNKLPQRVVVVDECSMVGAELMCTLMQSLADGTRLILVGDADQLPSVDCGSVFRDIVKKLNEQKSPLLQRLVHSRRSVKEIIHEAHKALEVGLSASFSWSHVTRGETPAHAPVRFINGIEGMAPNAKYTDWLQQLLGQLFKHFAGSSDWAAGGAAIGRFKIIAPRREGPAGVNDINQRLHELAKKHWGVGRSQFLVGEPVMISENIHALGLNNGDVGIISEMTSSKRSNSDKMSSLQATFLRGPKSVTYPLEQLTGRFERAWASTCHKAQGSEYDAVFIVLPEGNCDLVTNQWLYTAMTRAKTRLTVIRSHRG